MRCHACQTNVPLAASERVGFRDECAKCGSDLHSCLNCGFHDPSAYNECRESSAERVSDRRAANRCDYFSAGDAAASGVDDARSASLSDLDALFKK